MPDEGAPHAATWMAFGPSEEIWGGKLLSVVRENLAGIAKAIAAHEPVKMLVREEDTTWPRACAARRSNSCLNPSTICGCAIPVRSSSGIRRVNRAR
ncbi:MAG: Similar to Agmatine deiminase [uncultured Paraburkholderia sp.]|nr:MAG: Similar to Agmatine deiminase [uncultured Paraburkholderia sp.]CAH2940565.1 MAG: Similar to Agmatine deiminase [uncultured Paraburkholderia sp.]